MKRFLVLGLALLMMLTAFGGLAEETQDSGVYAEESIQLPEGYIATTSVSVAEDGTLLLAAQREDNGWDLLKWTDPMGTPEVVPLALDGQNVSSIDVAPDGNILVILAPDYGSMEPEENAGEGEPAVEDGTAPAEDDSSSFGSSSDGKVSFFGQGMNTSAIWLAPDGTMSAFATLEGYAMLTKALSGQRMAVWNYESGLQIFGPDGAPLAQITDFADATGLAATENHLITANADRITFYDIETGEKVREISANVGYSAQLFAAADGTVYYGNNDGIFAIAPDAQEGTLIMDPTGTLLGDPSAYLKAIGTLPDGRLVALMSAYGSFSGAAAVNNFAFSGGGTLDTLMLYTPVDASTLGDRQTFTITALRNSTRLRKAVSEFARKHPELDVKLQVQLSENDESPVDDHIRTLNTDLLAGKGGDVLILDGLPMDKYAQRGILADLRDLLPELGLLAGIAEGSTESDGSVYGIPAQFSFQTLWADKSLLDSITSLADLATADLPDGKNPLSARLPEDWLTLFFPASEAAFRDADGQLHFNTPEFEAFLEALYTLYSNQGELADVEVMANGRSTGGSSPMEMVDIFNGVTAFYPETVLSLMQLSTAYTAAGAEDSGFILQPTIDGKNNAYTPSLIAGINAQSSNQALAQEFIRILLGKEVQESDNFTALPTNAETLDTFVQQQVDMLDGSSAMVMTAMAVLDGGVMIEMKNPDVETFEKLRAICDTLKTPATLDETLLGFMVEETEAFFAGQISAQQAGEALEQRAWYYLNE